MQKERPIRPEESAALADQLRQAFASDEQALTVNFADQALHLHRVSRSEFTMEHAGAPTAARVLLGSESILAGYPSDLPYLPGEIVMLSGAEPRISAVWWSRNDPEELLAQIDRQSLASGWTGGDRLPIPSSDATHCTYRKGNLMRYVLAGKGIVSVSHRSTG
jgi:hypothetical protein